MQEIELVSKMMYSWLSYLPFEIFQMAFMQRAIIASIVLASICGLFGVLVVQYRMAFFSDAISHSAFAGFAIGVVLGIDPYLSNILFAAIMAIITIIIKKKNQMAMDTVLGILFAFNMAMGIAILSAYKEIAKSLPTFLYGDLLTITDKDLVGIIIMVIIQFIILMFIFNKIFFTGLNEILAKSVGINDDIIEIIFAIQLAILVSFCIKIVGVLLVTALIIIPASTARNVCNSLRCQVWVSIGASILASVIGIVGSIYCNVSVGASIIISAIGIFVTSIIIKNFLSKYLHNLIN